MTLATRFPHRFRIGNDICYIPRIRKILEGRLGTPFIRRILKPEEIGQPRTARILGARKNNAGGSLIFSAITRQDFQNNAESIKFFRAVEFMAGRFAAKEAVIKAHPALRLTFQSIDILRDDSSFYPGKIETDMETDTTTEMGTETTNEMISVQASTKDSSPLWRKQEDRGGPLVAMISRGDEFPPLFASVSISHDTDYAAAVCLAI